MCIFKRNPDNSWQSKYHFLRVHRNTQRNANSLALGKLHVVGAQEEAAISVPHHVQCVKESDTRINQLWKLTAVFQTPLEQIHLACCSAFPFDTLHRCLVLTKEPTSVVM